MVETRSSPDKPKVLIVDDEPDMLDFMARVLRRNFAVTVTDDAQEALHRLQSSRYDLLITDHQMPKVSGLELISQVGAAQPELICIVISGFAEAPDILQAMEDGAVQNYLLKPVDSRKLLGAIEQAYNSRG